MEQLGTQESRVLALARKLKVVRLKDVVDQGLHPEHLRRLQRKGLVVRIDRGVYRLADDQFSEKVSLAEAAKRVPNGCVFRRKPDGIPMDIGRGSDPSRTGFRLKSDKVPAESGRI